MQLPASRAGQKIELRANGPTEKLLGTLVTTATGGWDMYTLETTSIARISGIHDLYLDIVAPTSAGIGNIRSIKFT